MSFITESLEAKREEREGAAQYSSPVDYITANTQPEDTDSSEESSDGGGSFLSEMAQDVTRLLQGGVNILAGAG